MLLFQDNKVFSCSEDFALLLCRLIFISLFRNLAIFSFYFFLDHFILAPNWTFNLITAPVRGASDTINSILQKTDWSIPSHRTEYDRQIEQFNPQGRFGYL